MSQLNSGQLKNSQSDAFEHDTSAVAKRVVLVPTLSGSRIIGSATSGDPLYIGKGQFPGVGESENYWTISRVIYTSGTGLVEVKIATGSWNNRASLTYQ